MAVLEHSLPLPLDSSVHSTDHNTFLDMEFRASHDGPIDPLCSSPDMHTVCFPMKRFASESAAPSFATPTCFSASVLPSPNTHLADPHEDPTARGFTAAATAQGDRRPSDVGPVALPFLLGEHDDGPDYEVEDDYL